MGFESLLVCHSEMQDALLVLHSSFFLRQAELQSPQKIEVNRGSLALTAAEYILHLLVAQKDERP